jgi:hypothetical protein
VTVEDESEFVVGQWPVFVGEPDSAVELGVPAELSFQAGHSDEDEADLGPVVAIAQDFVASAGEAFGFVDDHQLDSVDESMVERP